MNDISIEDSFSAFYMKRLNFVSCKNKETQVYFVKPLMDIQLVIYLKIFDFWHFICNYNKSTAKKCGKKNSISSLLY